MCSGYMTRRETRKLPRRREREGAMPGEDGVPPIALAIRSTRPGLEGCCQRLAPTRHRPGSCSRASAGQGCAQPNQTGFPQGHRVLHRVLHQVLASPLLPATCHTGFSTRPPRGLSACDLSRLPHWSEGQTETSGHQAAVLGWAPGPPEPVALALPTVPGPPAPPPQAVTPREAVATVPAPTLQPCHSPLGHTASRLPPRLVPHAQGPQKAPVPACPGRWTRGRAGCADEQVNSSLSTQPGPSWLPQPHSHPPLL